MIHDKTKHQSQKITKEQRLHLKLEKERARLTFPILIDLLERSIKNQRDRNSQLIRTLDSQTSPERERSRERLINSVWKLERLERQLAELFMASQLGLAVERSIRHAFGPSSRRLEMEPMMDLAVFPWGHENKRTIEKFISSFETWILAVPERVDRWESNLERIMPFMVQTWHLEHVPDKDWPEVREQMFEDFENKEKCEKALYGPIRFGCKHQKGESISHYFERYLEHIQLESRDGFVVNGFLLGLDPDWQSEASKILKAQTKVPRHEVSVFDAFWVVQRLYDPIVSAQLDRKRNRSPDIEDQKRIKLEDTHASKNVF